MDATLVAAIGDGDNTSLALQPLCNARCARCGDGFDALRSTGRYCSVRCRVSAHRARKAKAEKLRRVEWYSPPEAVDAARCTMGGVDLDPASCEEANEIIRARCIFTAGGSGLVSSWWGRVWLNPPYGRLGPRFIRKLAAEIRNGNVEQACALLSSTHLSAHWFHDAVDGLGDPIICIVRGRLQFSGPNRRTKPAHGSVVVGLAVSHQRFAEAFGPLGIVTGAASGQR